MHRAIYYNFFDRTFIEQIGLYLIIPIITLTLKFCVKDGENQSILHNIQQSSFKDLYLFNNSAIILLKHMHVFSFAGSLHCISEPNII